jgi:hypothetical protein
VCRGCGPVTARVGERLWKALCVEDDHLQVSISSWGAAVEGAVCRGCGPVTARVGERLWKALCVEDVGQ